MMHGKEKIQVRIGFSSEGNAMNAAFKKATKKAVKEAFKIRTTILVEKDGWLVAINKAGKVVKRVKRLEQVAVPAP
ncbi:MAG: hypothetical protein JST38_10195 [Bacteroidetes bacterium]|nr:hypothetical protein [Bacteroidota bacterium]MBS1941234.1 hypothetical protein [Bacteroidota bacterium]